MAVSSIVSKIGKLNCYLPLIKEDLRWLAENDEQLPKSEEN